MSGLSCSFDEQDTGGTIFFTFGAKIALLEFVINKQGFFAGEPFIQPFFPDKNIIFVDWLRHSH